MPISTTELFDKLSQLEEQARLASQEYPRGLTLERLRYIVALTRLLRGSVQRDAEEEQAKSKIVAIARPQDSG